MRPPLLGSQVLWALNFSAASALYFSPVASSSSVSLVHVLSVKVECQQQQRQQQQKKKNKQTNQ